ncbi:MAG: glycosyltransferase [Actinomycetota bacterium]
MSEVDSLKIKSRRIIFAGGGTAGHVEPALAVARGWQEKFPNDCCEFIGTESGLENRLVPQSGFTLKKIDKVVAPRKINLSLLTLPWRLLRAVNQTRQIVEGADLLMVSEAMSLPLLILQPNLNTFPL